jgi:hypothetical protein
MFNFLKTTAETGIIVPVIVYNKIGWVLNFGFECVSDDFVKRHAEFEIFDRNM